MMERSSLAPGAVWYTRGLRGAGDLNGAAQAVADDLVAAGNGDLARETFRVHVAQCDERDGLFPAAAQPGGRDGGANRNLKFVGSGFDLTPLR